MTTVGLLYPGYSAEDDYPALVRRLERLPDPPGIALPLVHTTVGEDAHRVDALLDLGGHERLAEGVAALLAGGPIDSLVWACTSGSFVFGWDGAEQQVARLGEVAGVPASSTSFAFVRAAQALDLARVAVVASYPHDVAESFADFLAAGGISVVGLGSHGIVTAAEVGTLGPERVVELVSGELPDDAQAVLVPDTAMHTLDVVDRLEEAAGRPVLTANQVTVWEGLRLAGKVPRLPGLGTLFAADQGVSSSDRRGV
jgi:maleate cis-trans isomerase